MKSSTAPCPRPSPSLSWPFISFPKPSNAPATCPCWNRRSANIAARMPLSSFTWAANTPSDKIGLRVIRLWPLLDRSQAVPYKALSENGVF